MSRSRNRPPHLEPRIGHQQVAPPPTLQQLLERAHVAGAAVGPGPAELRRHIERAAADRAHPVPLDDAWAAVGKIFGASVTAPAIDANLTIAAARRAVNRISAVATTGARIASATSRPGSLLVLHLALARFARISGGDVVDCDDATPMRIDGRSPRWVRWVDGVAVVTDGESLCATRGAEAAHEWLFMIPRPALVIADGPYADAAVDAGIEVVAFAGLDHCSLALAKRPDRRGFVVPMWTERPPAAYRPLLECALAGGGEPEPARDERAPGSDT